MIRICVVLAGILDPKWPLPAFGADGAPSPHNERLVLSPFDEAALELALKLRDASPSETAISVLILNTSEKLGRAVAAYNIADITCLEIDSARRWDLNATAEGLATAIDERGGADLILIGREAGDCDGGVFPTLIAAHLGAQLFSLAQYARREGGRVSLMREVGDCEEWASLEQPLVASITNDRRNRLRKPLMKNVQAARSASIGRAALSLPDSQGRFLSLAARASERRKIACRKLAGAPDEQAAQLARFLAAEARA